MEFRKLVSPAFLTVSFLKQARDGEQEKWLNCAK